MTSDQTRNEFSTNARGLAVAPPAGAAARDRADMHEAADFLMEDEGVVETLLADGGVPLVHEGGDTYVLRHDLRSYRERERVRRRAGMREITRLSIAAGLDDVDYSAIERDRA